MSERASIFLAEDSPADVYLFREALKAHGVDTELVVFGDGEAAMSFLTTVEQSGPVPQLFVLDLNLPKIDGRAILKYLRDHQRFAQSLVMILTSSSNVADREESIRCGANCFIQKAQNINEFLDIGRRIKEMLRKA
jgi:two-component system, chemotaxis family, response regulator Rcp1